MFVLSRVLRLRDTPLRRTGFRFVLGTLFLAVIIFGAIFHSFSPARAQTTPAQAKIRVLDFNTEASVCNDACKEEVCGLPLLEYSLNKVRFLSFYMREHKIDIGSFQELHSRCNGIDMKKDALGRDTPILGGPQLEAIKKFKDEFKGEYEKHTKKTFSEAQFEAELTRVLGKETFEDVWVRFLPFDETFWVAMDLAFLYNYPMETIAKPYGPDTQWFRTATYSRFPLSRPLNSSDFVPIKSEGVKLSDTRWTSRAPLHTALGLLNVYNVHTRAAGDGQPCQGTKEAFKFAEETYGVDKTISYILTGDFNRQLKNGICTDSSSGDIRERYELIDWGEETAIDYVAVLHELPIDALEETKEVLYARSGEVVEWATPSDHNGFSVEIQGPKAANQPKPLTSVTFPDYRAHSDEDDYSKSGPKNVNLPSNTSPGLPLCSEVDQSAPPTAVGNLAQEIQEFFSKGAQGYLVWLYSGDSGLGAEFASDQYSFFRNIDPGSVCATLKAAADANPGKFVGVNMHDAGNEKHSEAKIADNFSWLKNTCGVTVIRTFSKSGGGVGASKLIAAAEQAGVQVMFSIGDYSNGGGGIPSGVGSEFFTSGYRGEYLGLVNEVVAATRGRGGLFGYELANEVHCRGDAGALTSYRAWGEEIGAIMRGGSGNVGYGQKATENTTLCDSPGVAGPSGQSHFEYTNSAPSISMTSGHYYNGNEKTLALEALAQSQAMGKMFYIGEAPAAVSSSGANASIACISPEKYYIQPINGVNGITETNLTRENPTGHPLDVIRDELIMQGYEARCAAPGFKITMTEFGRDAMEKLFQQPVPIFNGVVVGGGPGGGFSEGENRVDTTEKVYSRLDVDYRDILVPLYRDLDRTTPALKRSIEDFLGHKETNDSVFTSAEIKTSAINSLLSNQQRCTVAYQNLSAQNTMCQKLDNPDACALYATEIPMTSGKRSALSSSYYEHVASAQTVASSGPSV